MKGGDEMKKRVVKKVDSPFYMAKFEERRIGKRELMEYINWAELNYSRITNRMLNRVFINSEYDIGYQMNLRGLSFNDLF
ncbi:hypothetical protein [Levilactobacillus sp. N40-8-2]|uniref:hypothetical protein n=1 Tax=Levilactobacillus muriae TaxID=3238987 RepID=UPI0038B2AAEB